MWDRNIRIPMADSHWCMAKTNTVLWSNYLSIKNKLIKKKIKSPKEQNSSVCFFLCQQTINSILTWSTWTAQRMYSLKTAPTADANWKSRLLPVLLTNQLYKSEVPTTLSSGSINLLRVAHKTQRHIYSHLQCVTKDVIKARDAQPDEEVQGKGCGDRGRASTPFQVHRSPHISMCSPTWSSPNLVLWGFYMCIHESHSVVFDSVNPRTIQSMEFSRPEYWSG